MIDFTPLVRGRFIRQAARMDGWDRCASGLQARQLRELLRQAAGTSFGIRRSFAEMAAMEPDAMRRAFATRVKVVEYEEIRPQVMQMAEGKPDVLWPGVCRYFAQSSGTSGGVSKYIPITDRSLRVNHYAGASDVVAAYLRANPASRLFSGKALILGGSFANTLAPALAPQAHVGDLSATLIARTPRLAELFRIPSRKIALMADWEQKLPALVDAAMKANVTNLSGVPSWFLILLRRVLEKSGASTLQQVWPGLEVFFHGGISFEPYRAQYREFTDASKMHFMETYNASEGFFAVQTDPADSAMQLLLDRGIYYEFAPMLPGGEWGGPLPLEEVKADKVYAMVISAPNGLWRYWIGDTVRFTDPRRARIRIAGRTKSYINAFGEELMEHNADAAIAAVCAATGAAIANYTAGPVYAASGRRGRHRWLIEWITPPADEARFAALLDTELRRLNSDYDAKRTGDIFLDPLQLTTLPAGAFDRWLATHGSGKLGGQRKIPRLSPTPAILEALLSAR